MHGCVTLHRTKIAQLEKGAIVDLEQISDNDLAGLLQLFHALAAGGKNRVAHDLYIIIEREGTRRHQSTPIAEYEDNQVVEAVNALTSFVDDMRAKGATDDHPGLHFILESVTVLIGEAERRGLVKPLQ
ncbi:MAG: hypothetical protein HW419_2383 [Deltaproteobacteria bacterium]|nr:hypothetical protein [Deltaproteobacteria bacterium]